MLPTLFGVLKKLSNLAFYFLSSTEIVSRSSSFWRENVFTKSFLLYYFLLHNNRPRDFLINLFHSETKSFSELMLLL